MKRLRSWSLMRLLLAAAASFVLGVALCVAVVVLQATWNIDIGSGSGGIGAVSVGVSGLLLVVPFVPPILLLALWLKARRSRP
jgi:hypothetical protein